MFLQLSSSWPFGPFLPSSPGRDQVHSPHHRHTPLHYNHRSRCLSCMREDLYNEGCEEDVEMEMFWPTCSTGELESEEEGEEEGEVHGGQAGDQSAAQPLLWQSHWWRLDWSALPPSPPLTRPAMLLRYINSHPLTAPHPTGEFLLTFLGLSVMSGSLYFVLSQCWVWLPSSELRERERERERELQNENWQFYGQEWGWAASWSLSDSDLCSAKLWLWLLECQPRTQNLTVRSPNASNIMTPSRDQAFSVRNKIVTARKGYLLL